MGIRAVCRWSNIQKTIRYFRKNGFSQAVYAVLERISDKSSLSYRYEPPAAETLEKQKNHKWEYIPKISIIVPAYKTSPKFFGEMIDSVRSQTYRHWELIIADASPGKEAAVLKDICEKYEDERILYQHLEKNGGISYNSNAALAFATGEYVGLLDHDDVLTIDCLYWVAEALQEHPVMVFSDEDKCDSDLSHFYEPNRKEKFNYELILSNNYICHFTVIKTDVIKSLGFRTEYDGAQDYDLFLRCIAYIDGRHPQWMTDENQIKIKHIGKVLYHWRCHGDSTAENPESKMYAYEAGKRALEDFIKHKNWHGSVSHTAHLGFYRIEYHDAGTATRQETPDSVEAANNSAAADMDEGTLFSAADMDEGTLPSAAAADIDEGTLLSAADMDEGILLSEAVFWNRPEVGAYCGRRCRWGKVVASAYGLQEEGLYLGMNRHYSGTMHRASLRQAAYAPDITTVHLRKELWEDEAIRAVFQGMECNGKGHRGLHAKEIKKRSLMLGKILRDRGYLILYDPKLEVPSWKK